MFAPTKAVLRSCHYRVTRQTYLWNISERAKPGMAAGKDTGMVTGKPESKAGRSNGWMPELHTAQRGAHAR